MTCRGVVGSIVIAIVVAFAVPVSQLRTASTVTACCCPDPESCHCPDHQPDHGTQSSIRACHRTSHDSVSPQAPSFTAPQLAIVVAPARRVPVALAMPDAPHAPPVAARPDAPS